MSFYDGKPQHHTHVSRLAQRQHQPVKSGKGGYLRCPFSISATFADLASKHVAAGQNPRARASPLGLGSAVHHTKGSASSGRHVDKDGLEADDNAGRAWTRAGVGAQSLSAKEKRAQQELAEFVYNNNRDNNGSDGDDGHAEEDEAEIADGLENSGCSDRVSTTTKIPASTKQKHFVHNGEKGDNADTARPEETEDAKSSQEQEAMGEEEPMHRSDGDESHAEESVAKAENTEDSEAKLEANGDEEEEEDDGVSNIIAKAKKTQSIYQKSADRARRNQFGLDMRDQQALKKAMPRFLRRGEELHSGSRGDENGQMHSATGPHHGFNSDVVEQDEDDEVILSKSKQASVCAHGGHHHHKLLAAVGGPNGQSQRARKKALKRQRASDSAEPLRGHEQDDSNRSVGHKSREGAGEVRETAPTADLPVTTQGHSPPTPPVVLNRMQRLEEARLAALLGKNKKKRR